MRFWDSSAVLPLFARQDASTKVDAWLREDPVLAIWTLTPVEITSALWRLVREGAVDEDVAVRADSRAQEVVAASYLVVDVEGVKVLARRLLRMHAVRAADAMQLGAALLWSGGQPHNRMFLTLDARLAVAARREGFIVL